MPPLVLRKWYMDAANAAGDAWIGYRAELRWPPLHVDFTHQLRRSVAGGVSERGEFRGVAEPEWTGADTLRWSIPGLDAEWRRTGTPAIRETLLDGPAGRIAWACVLPRAHATLRAGADALEGTGYVERLELSLASWRLPFRVLHWGRCHAASHDLVWIRWEGAEARSVAWLDGVRCASADVTETDVLAPPARWECGERVTLRRGVIGRTLLAPLRALGGALPAAALAADEHKWTAGGRLVVDGAGEDAIAIAERVAW